MRGLLIVASLACGCARAPVVPVAPSNRSTAGEGDERARPARGSIAGYWREYWGEPGDLDYNDEYLIELGARGVTVQTVSRDYPISEVAYRGGVLTFTQETSFPVRYRLTLSRDRTTLDGTANTPTLEAKIRWERFEPEPTAPVPPTPTP